MLLHRPAPVICEHRGVKAKLDFKWGTDLEPVPKGVTISLQLEEHPIALVEMAEYSSFEQAKDRGMELAKVEIDLVLDGARDS